MRCRNTDGCPSGLLMFSSASEPLANFPFSLVPAGVKYRGTINEIRLSLPGDSLTADPKRPNFLALSAPTPLNVQSVRLTVAQ